MRVNLLEERAGPAVDWKELMLLFLVIISILLPTAHYFYHHLQLGQMERQLAAERQKLIPLRELDEEYHKLSQKIDEFVMPEKPKTDRVEIGRALETLGLGVPVVLSLERIRLDKGQMRITGYTEEVSALLSLISHLESSAYYERVTLDQFRRNNELNFVIDARPAAGGE